MKQFAWAVLFLALNALLFAQGDSWKDQNGKPLPNTESRRAQSGFAGRVVATSDADWKAKWETSPNTIPTFTETKAVKQGDQIFVLTFFAGPKLNDSGAADVTCDLDVTRPNGSSSAHLVNAPCVQGEFKGDPNNVFLAAPIIQFIVEPTDLTGKWLVQVTIKDNIRHVALPLKTSFTLE